MKVVLIVRHGIAEDRGPHGDDRLRALTEDGSRRVRRVARGLARLREVPDMVISSPLVRARETAEILAEELHVPHAVRLSDALAPGGTPQDVVDLLAEAMDPPDVVRVALVGHMPGVAGLVAAFAGSGSGLRVAFKKAGVARFEFSARPAVGRGILTELLSARVLRALGR